MPKLVSQRKWIKGVVANVPETAQPPDSLARASNIIYTRRGAIRTCDGSHIITANGGVLVPNSGPFTEIFLLSPNQVNRYYIGIIKDPTMHVPLPPLVSNLDGGAGGSLGAGTYIYLITGLDGAGGETNASQYPPITILANHLVNLTWTLVNNTNGGYNIYRTAAGGAAPTAGLLATVGSATSTFQDNGSLSPNFAITPPGQNTTQQCPFYRFPGTSYGPGNLLFTFPADLIVPDDGTPGTGPGTGSGGGTTSPSSGAGATPQGGVIGNISDIPMIVQFANKAFLALGNGFPPYVYADTTQPDWTGTTQFQAAAVIKPLTNNAGGYYFVAQTGGTTSGANPVFPQIVGNTVADGNITWRNVGLIPVFALFNTFQSTYPDWNTNITYAVGDKIKPSANNAGGFIFTCLQGGASGAGAPTFPQSQGQTVAESAHNVLWQNTGVGTTSPAPRAAAHAEVYAGALWVANTQPTTTTDQLDGPSALRMSDINNPISWNPLNTAFIDRDDGDQVTGLKSMTIAESGIPPTGSLCVFKNNSLFQVNGVFGSSNFSIQRAQTDLGCTASRTIVFCPGFGIIRFTHLGFALFDTTRDRVISEQIKPYLFRDPNISDIVPVDWNLMHFAKAAQCVDPPMYMCAVPLSLNNLPLNAAGGVTVTTQAGVSTWPIPNNYFFRVTRFTTLSDGTVFESSLTTRVSITLLDAVTVVKVQSFGGVLDTGATKFRVYVGNLTPDYFTNYVEFTPAQMAAGQTLTGFGSTPNLGTILNGLGGLTRLLCYDLVLKCWAVIDLPFAISVLRQVRPPGSEPITVVGGFSDGAMRRIQAGDPDWDGTPITWKFRPAELMSGGGSTRVFYQRVNLKGVGNPSTIQITPSYDFSDDLAQTPINYTFGASRFASWLDLFTTALTAHVNVSGTGIVEIDAVDWEVEALPEGVPTQFA